MALGVEVVHTRVHQPAGIALLVSRLRQRLGDDAREPACIKTVRSEGYVFSLPVQLLESPL